MLPQFQFMLTRHVVLQSLQSAQWAACNRLHNAEQRLARWLLTMHDRTEEDSLRVTHDFLASMLGTDRPSVSLAAGLLQRKEAITYSRGSIKILDRQRLQESVCECHEVMQRLGDPINLT
jgi:CRP-like cAMP-binding protein